ncbi:beta-lactamase-like protein 3 isoform X2 [Hydra vulgaris]|uniref:beta-lactamase-like protein 3 isoform X2 n=1 Tax=Hydra vulgaris TaxID=6087 RepID=UPI001F5FD72B|nr:beta-lactamase-like protein 3 isoform X2 [Hydra vulgaris]
MIKSGHHKIYYWQDFFSELLQSLIYRSNKTMPTNAVINEANETEKRYPNGFHIDKEKFENSIPWSTINGYSETLPEVCTTIRIPFDKSESQKHKSKCVYGLLVFALFSLVVTFSTLYALEFRKKKVSENKITKIPLQTSEPCFERVYAKSISNIINYSEYQEAVLSSKSEIGPELFNGKYEAVSITVTYFGEEIWKFNYSYTTNKNLNTDTPFPIASVSKIFTVLMLHKLVELDIIKSIDDPVQKYMPIFFIKNKFNSKNITFRHLACMMAGIQREAPCYPYTNISTCPFNNTVMLERIQKLSLKLPPKQTPSYSNLAASILGRVLEDIVGRNVTLEAWMDENIIKPLNMTNTGYNIHSRIKDIPKSYNSDGSIAEILDWGWSRPSGGMFSTTHDLGKLSSVFFSVSDIFSLSERSLNELFAPAFTWSDNSAQGCPFEIATLDPFNPENKKTAYINFAKDGYVPGYGTMFNLVPDLKLNVNVMVASNESQAAPISKIVVKNFSKAVDQILKKKKEYIPPPDFKYYIGEYKLQTKWPLIQKPVRVYEENNVLLINIEWFTAKLSYVENRTLETVNYEKDQLNQRCEILGLGVLHEKYHFFPTLGEMESQGFKTDAIAIYGFAEFRRI